MVSRDLSGCLFCQFTTNLLMWFRNLRSPWTALMYSHSLSLPVPLIPMLNLLFMQKPYSRLTFSILDCTSLSLVLTFYLGQLLTPFHSQFSYHPKQLFLFPYSFLKLSLKEVNLWLKFSTAYSKRKPSKILIDNLMTHQWVMITCEVCHENCVPIIMNLCWCYHL